MPEDNAPSLMDSLLQKISAADAKATLYLKNGIKLEGKIIAYDKEYIHLTCRDELGMVVDRTAMSSVQRFNPDDRSGGGGNSRPRS